MCVCVCVCCMLQDTIAQWALEEDGLPQIGRSEHLSMTKEIHIVQKMRHTHSHGRDNDNRFNQT